MSADRPARNAIVILGTPDRTEGSLTIRASVKDGGANEKWTAMHRAAIGGRRVVRTVYWMRATIFAVPPCVNKGGTWRPTPHSSRPPRNDDRVSAARSVAQSAACAQRRYRQPRFYRRVRTRRRNRKKS
jgi:hypothetical protein